MLDSALQQELQDPRGWWGVEAELARVPLGLNLSPIPPAAPALLSHCGNPAGPLQCLELFLHRALHQGTILKPSWAILSQTHQHSADLR